MRRNKLSTSSMNSHLDLTMFKNIIQTNNKALTPNKKLFSNPFSKKVIDSIEIKQSGSLSNRLEEPFRFVTHVDFANNSFLAFVDIQKGQEVFATGISSAIDSLKEFKERVPVIARIIDALKSVCTVAADLEITDSVDTPVISRISPIELAHLEYLSAYSQLKETKIDNDQKLAFVLEGLQSILLTPFQRILDYRYFLRKVLRCDQHLCDKRGCKSRTCSVKMRMDAMNDTATKQLSQTIRKCYSFFNLVDNFPGLIEWEDKLNTSKCESIGPSEEWMNIDLHLTAPYNIQNQKMAELPTLLYSELFRLIPFSVRPHKGKDKTFLRINLFSDFILITIEDGINSELRFPPIPVTHISIETNLGEEKTVTLKLSPFKMLLLEPCIQSNGIRLLQLFKSLLVPISKVPTTPLTKSSSYSPLVLYKVFCRPFLWKLASDGVLNNEFEWLKLSKSDLTLRSVDGASIVLCLNADGNGRLILSGAINPSTEISQVSAKRLQITVTDSSDGIKKKLLIQVATTSVLTELMEEFEKCIHISLQSTIEKIKGVLGVSPLPSWVSNSLSLKVKELGCHKSVMVQNSQCAGKNWVHLGPAKSFVVLAGPANECTYLCMHIQSALDQCFTFLELDLRKSKLWSSRKEGMDIILRVYLSESSELFTDYFLDLRDCNDTFSSELQSLGQEAKLIEEMIQEEVRKHEELKQLERDLQRLNTVEETIPCPLIAFSMPSTSKIEESESVLSLVNTITDEDVKRNIEKQLDPKIAFGTASMKEYPLKVSDSSASLATETEFKCMDFELGSLLRELRVRERETRKLYEQFCSLDEEKKRLLKRSAK